MNAGNDRDGMRWQFMTVYLNCKAKTITHVNDLPKQLPKSQAEIMRNLGMWINQGSGWIFSKIKRHYLNVAMYQPLKAASYIKLPEELRNSSKGLINIQNDDTECFRWCHITTLNPQNKYPQRITSSDRTFVERLNYSGTEFQRFSSPRM